MHITFIGNPRNPADTTGRVRLGGVDFPLNLEVEVSETPLFTKLRKNDHFAVRDGDSKPALTSAEPPKPAAKSDEKAELIAFAEQHGVKIDKRWSVEKITQAIDAAASQREQAEPSED